MQIATGAAYKEGNCKLLPLHCFRLFKNAYIQSLFFVAYTLCTMPFCWAVVPYVPTHPDPVLEPWRWRSYPELKGRGVNCIAEENNGYIWAVSEDRTHGVNIFNGQTWSAFRLSELGGSDINPSIVQTTNGTVWIGGQEGVLHARYNNKWTTYQTPHLPLPEARITQLFESKASALWVIGQGSEPVRLDYGTKQWTTFDGLNYQCQSLDRQFGLCLQD